MKHEIKTTYWSCSPWLLHKVIPVQVVRKWCVKNCLGTGKLSMKEKSGSEGDACFLSWKYCLNATQGQITGFLIICSWHRVVMFDLECLSLKWGI